MPGASSSRTPCAWLLAVNVHATSDGNATASSAPAPPSAAPAVWPPDSNTNGRQKTPVNLCMSVRTRVGRGRREDGAPVRRDDVAVPLARILDRARLRLVVDVDQAEAVLVALGPLEVVEDRPVEVALDRDAGRDRRRQLAQVARHEVDAIGIVHAAFVGEPGAHREAVLDDDDRQLVA